MFNLKYNGIFAITAFILSLLIGLVSRSTMPMLIVRPLIFAILFFAITAFGNILVSRFLPELLEDRISDEDSAKPGSSINILEDDSQPYSAVVPDGFLSASGQASAGATPDDSEDDLGDISELSKKIAFSAVAGETDTGIDQDAKESYTGEGGSGDSVEPDFSNMFGSGSPLEASASSQEKAAGTGAKASANAGAKASTKSAKREGNSDEALPDLDSMAEAFMSESSNEGSEANEYSGPVSPKKSSSNKAPKWTEDFNAKEIAMGLRSVLKKDKEG